MLFSVVRSSSLVLDISSSELDFCNLAGNCSLLVSFSLLLGFAPELVFTLTGLPGFPFLLFDSLFSIKLIKISISSMLRCPSTFSALYTITLGS